MSPVLYFLGFISRRFALCSLLAVSASNAAQGQGVCGVPSLGDPCMLGGVASAGSAEPMLGLGAGNPVHLATGNKYQHEIDLPAHPLAPGLELVRHYNSMSPRHGVLGRGWTLSYDTRLSRSGANWRIVQADGSHVDFTNLTGEAGSAGLQGTLRRDGKGWIWRWPGGRELRFDARGRLGRIARAGGGQTLIHRSRTPGPLAETIERVTGPDGHELTFRYRVEEGQAYLERVDTRLGPFRYQYDPAPGGGLQLAAVVRPDGMRRRYLHEPALQSGNTHALTGIVVANADGTQSERLNTWGYDLEGRANQFHTGRGAKSSAVTRIQYETPISAQHEGVTTLQTGTGERNRYTIGLRGGRHVLLHSSGPGCPACPPTGLHASYDPQGRLSRLNDTELQRDPDGRLRALKPAAAGWPGLVLHYPAQGKRHAWSSALTAQERLDYTARGLLRQRHFANGDSIVYDYDPQGRPIRINSTAGALSELTSLTWRASVPVSISHPQENETRQYDEHKRLKVRTVRRAAAQADTVLHYRESFEYDKEGRLTVHHLPEGGALHYRWGPERRLHAITWQPESGTAQTVIDTVPGLAGYRYGNGLHLHVAAGKDGNARQLVVSSDTALLWAIDLHHDARGRLATETHTHTQPDTAAFTSWRYGYDSQNRMIAHRQGAGRPSWLAWNDDGSLAAIRPGEANAARLGAQARRGGGIEGEDEDAPEIRPAVNGGGFRPDIRRDASGLPQLVDGRRLRYGPGRRLREVVSGQGPPAEYRHNAFGYRIIKRTSSSNVDYFYLDNRLVGERKHVPSTALPATTTDASVMPTPTKTAAITSITAATPGTTPATGARSGRIQLSRRYIYAQHVPVGFIDYMPGQAEQAALYAVHADMVGAATVVTDADQRIRWSARYSPTGEAEEIHGDLTFDLRLPGQVFDAESGMHDNVLRTYHPGYGHYLEPDPLGPLPGQQALGYARQQARRYIDPTGLLLFAFDGTRLSSDSRSNVWKLSQAYADGPAHYHAGPGNSLYIEWDAVTAWQASRIIDTQWQYLLNGLSQASGSREHIPIDIIGFSRGAALARHFGNLVVEHTQGRLFSFDDPVRGPIRTCVDLRFMGLFDTVAQFGLAGSHNGQYDLTIAAAWDWVAHAVALNERRWLYPVSSVADAAGANTVEAPFIGAHADIGGGTLYDDDGSPLRRGDLSDVALNWMLWQARAATADFRLSDVADREITEPILHDERSALLRSVQDGDRSVLAASGTKIHEYQDQHTRLGRTLRASAEAVIARHDDWRSRAGPEVGTVDLDGYARWLYEELGWGAAPGSAEL